MTVRPHRTDFHEIRYLSIFQKSVQKMQVPLKSDKNNSYFREDLRTSVLLARSGTLRMRNVSDSRGGKTQF
jgi:hypothetical protein